MLHFHAKICQVIVSKTKNCHLTVIPIGRNNVREIFPIRNSVINGILQPLIICNRTCKKGGLFHHSLKALYQA